MKYALCIGINDYGGGSNLEGCVNDALDWADILTRRYSYKTQLLLDKQATGDGIRNAVASVLTNATHYDRIVITYSGHGSYVPDISGDESDGVDECWCGSDVNRSSRGILTDDELSTLLKARASSIRVAVISDSCFSGTMTRLFTPSFGVGQRHIRFLSPATFLPAEEMRRLKLGRAFARVSKQYPAVLVSGCQDDEYSYDAWFGGRANGAFTRAALDTLQTGLSYRQWYKKIREMLPSRDYPQTPNLDAGFWQKFWTVFE